MSMAYRISALLSHVDGSDLDRAVLGGRDLRRQSAGLVDRRRLEDEEAAERLLYLGVRPVRDELLAVPDADRRRSVRRLELRAPDDLWLLREVHVALVDGLLLFVAHRLPAVLVGVDQCQEFHVSPF